MNRNLAVAVALCFSNTPLLSGWAFPIQKTTSVIPRGPAKYHPPFLPMNNRHALRVSMVSEDNSDPNVDGSNDDLSYPRPSEQPENILSEFESHIDWEPVPIDIDDMNDFFDTIDYPGDEYVDIDDTDELLQEFDKETLLEILGLEDDGETITIPDDEQFADWNRLISDQVNTQTKSGIDNKGIEDLERALMRGVVPADAGVGSGMLPADYGFDPWELSTKDYFKQIQNFILNFVPKTKNIEQEEPEAGAAMPTVGFVGEKERPPALILRDYRDAEIRHGRLAMLAAVIWPLQEILDRIFIPNSFGSTTAIYGGPTMPFLPLIMTFFMLNLGYLDIYSTEIKENESGDAFLPGECFWDPLCVLEGAPDSMKRNMQEREILNGRAAMIAVAAFIFEEAMTHKPIVSLPTNMLLFEPAYQIPFIQEWLDCAAMGQCIDHSL
eukprot:CAMPEP_0201869994 /NCGR_PEP_ID=MMETSP0902-20130614/3287_1 /ASSEMBLY_ACC=CAM_ASM_000551 /TAXON_ID=420261 /ORGANISM="Thalassiosira antarctica, Strain CCMP982" /LENGTH=438 /DNA_ID=CAMNT_0048395563 /DNA_START=68 /DNA_END=1384 /DNA_ORIENTATION=-